MENKIQELIDKFKELYGEGETRVYFAPGRVNLIGEHTDYNGGHVFPCALTLGTYAVVRPRTDRTLRFFSVNFPRSAPLEYDLDSFAPKAAKVWTTYPMGVMWSFEEHGLKIPTGFDMLIWGNIPNGSGLSSSAALEVLTGTILKDTFGFEDLTPDRIAQYCQYSENNYNGVNCGIMDQFASAMGKKDHAIFLDTNTLQYEYVPVKLEDACLVITNSNVKHSLASSAYNDRRAECEKALEELQNIAGLNSFGDLDEKTFEYLKPAIADEVRQRRAKHAVYENRRTIRAVEALRASDIAAFGQLMNQSHISLRDDYEVSCEEIDLLVDLAWKIPGVIGSRITGGGFGGCTVSIVRKDAVDTFRDTIGPAYEEKTGLQAEFYVVDIGDGAHRLI